MPKEPPVRCEAIFEGHVQGVGFRFTAVGVAKDYDVSGYVMNLRTGTVFLVAEGLRSDVSGLIQGILGAMTGYVTDHKETWKSATGEFGGFDVRYEGR